jgi:HSP20 family protein
MVVTQTDVSPTDQKKQEERTRHDMPMTRRGTSLSMSPLTLLQRFFSDDIVNVLDQVGRGSLGSAPETSAEWAPTIDVIQRGNELVVRADLPGVGIDDVVVEVGDDTIR